MPWLPVENTTGGLDKSTEHHGILVFQKTEIVVDFGTFFDKSLGRKIRIIAKWRFIGIIIRKAN